MNQPANRRAVYAWALYDWGNSAFATTVIAGFFPLFFKQYWSGEASVTDSTFYLGIANSLSSLVILLLAPLLGAIADRSGLRKRFLFFFMLLGVAPTAGLYVAGQGEWELAAGLYVLANSGFAGSLIFYDALLLNVAHDHRLDRVSALGFALGYLGGGILFALNVAMTLSPELFGLADAAEAVRLSFVTVGLWWFIFTLPLMLWVREERIDVGRSGALAAGLQQFVASLRDISHYRTALLFLLAYWFYIDGVDTIIRMAVDYGLSIGLESKSLITALLIVQFVGFPAALLFGHFGTRYGPKRGIYVGLAVYTLVIALAVRMESEQEFYLLAIIIGLVQGGVQSLSRSLYARLIPREKSAEFFGLFNILGKFAAVLGPVMVGWTAAATGDPRLSLLSLLILFAVGAWFLTRVQVER